MKRCIFVLTILLFLLFAGSSYAGMSSIRCGDDLVSIGNTHITVKNTCGKPCLEEKCTKKKSGCRRMYYCINGYLDILSFEESKLSEIESTHEKCDVDKCDNKQVKKRGKNNK
jgi:hypothetical protein